MTEPRRDLQVIVRRRFSSGSRNIALGARVKRLEAFLQTDDSRPECGQRMSGRYLIAKVAGGWYCESVDKRN